MVDRDTLSRYVREVFAHLDDRPYLRSHPLARLLAYPGQPSSAEALRRALVVAIDELRPPEPILPNSHGWRRYRYLRRRYVEGADPDQIARELGISERQARREHQQALEAVAALLWERHGQPADGAPAAGPAEGEPPAVPAAGAALEAELTRVAGEPPQEPTPVGEVLSGALRTVASLAQSQRVAVELGEAEPRAPVAVQRIVLRQMVLGLLSTAIGLVPGGRVRLGAASAVGAVEVRVRASAASGTAAPRGGLAPARLAAVEELAAARRLAEAQGAALFVETPVETPGPAPGESAVDFALLLPAAESATVLVVDDNPDVARLFRRYLAGTSFRIVQARTGAGGLRLAVEERPDAIVLDVLLPSEDGWEVLEALRSEPATRETPVVVCSVLPDKLLALSLGVVDFLPKPVTRSALLAALERCREVRRPAGGPGRSSHSA